MLSILYNIVIAPIELLVEFVFELMFRLLGRGETNQGLAVVGVSLAISLSTLPLYRRADKIQQEEQNTQKKLAPGIKRIKETFSGDERFMILQTFYRENKYSPLSALKGSVSLLLEIPFFIAAYHFLSHLEVLNGASFGLIQNLGEADALLRFGTRSINLLPILMTTINCISGAIYLKGFPLKDKIQVYGMAVIFLVLLYGSPAGLVVYWTCNNIFSLVKNIFYKLKNPRKTLNFLCAALGILCTALVFASGILNSPKKYAAMVVFLICSAAPLLLNRIKVTPPRTSVEHSGISFIQPSLCMVLLTGLLIPASLIATSPVEFIDINDYKNPLHFLVSTSCYALGFFLFWTGIIRAMIKKELRPRFSLFLWAAALFGIVNYMCFGKMLGTISEMLVFDTFPAFSRLSIAINALVLIAIAALLFVLSKTKFRKSVFSFSCFVFIAGSLTLSLVNIASIQKKISDLDYLRLENEKSKNEKAVMRLSRTGKNVVVFMLDRAISGFFPLCLEEKAELKSEFSGFTFYPNAISFGGHTLFGAPPIFGGYEYTPKAMNERTEMTMKEKHNEALKVLPVLFSNEGYEVSVCDAPLANYEWTPDLSIFSDIPNVETHITKGKFANRFISTQDKSEVMKRNFFCYSIFKTAPLFLQPTLYDDGDYWSSYSPPYPQGFLDSFSALKVLNESTEFTDEEKNTFTIMNNETPHRPCLLNLPDYDIDETKIDRNYKGRNFDEKYQLESYHVNMATLIQLGKWLEFLKENGAYDNTRIIFVSDHGYKLAEKNGAGLHCFDDVPTFSDSKLGKLSVDCFTAFLLVKDFDSKVSNVDEQFMTNADVPAIALKDIVASPQNPFTKTPLVQEKNKREAQFITSSANYNPPDGNAVKLDMSDGQWYTVHDDIFNADNWSRELD